MATPILKQGNVLIASLQPGLTDSDLVDLRVALAEQIGRTRALGVVIDVSALDVVDSFAARTLLIISRAARLRGAETVIVGIAPDVAFAMVQLGITLGEVLTALDLESGIARLRMAQKGKLRV